MTNHKKLGLLLLPLVPLTAIGIVEVASSIVPPRDEVVAPVEPAKPAPKVIAPTPPPPAHPPAPIAPPHPAPSR